jgi:hypothetical protein
MPKSPLTINFRALAIVLTGAFYVVVALWIYVDATRRRAEKPVFAALATMLLGPFWLAFYLTDRPLCADERRSGGFTWNFARNFAWAWTGDLICGLPALPIVFPLVAAEAAMSARKAAESAPPDGLVAAFVFVLWLIVWLVPIALALGIAYWWRRPADAEAGGPAPARSPVPLAVCFVLSAVVSWLALSALHHWILPYS